MGNFEKFYLYYFLTRMVAGCCFYLSLFDPIIYSYITVISEHEYGARTNNNMGTVVHVTEAYPITRMLNVCMYSFETV